MTLSFREEAAVRSATEILDNGYTRDPADAVLMAQAIADACCKAWGHDWYYVRDEEKPRCRRCEQDVEPPPERPVDPGPSHAYRVEMDKQLRERDAAIEAAQVERDAARNALCDVLDALGVDDPKDAKREIHRLKARET